ncbi:MAG: acyl-CoA dehydrogenase family protein [Streptomyces sp.]
MSGAALDGAGAASRGRSSAAAVDRPEAAGERPVDASVLTGPPSAGAALGGPGAARAGRSSAAAAGRSRAGGERSVAAPVVTGTPPAAGEGPAVASAVAGPAPAGAALGGSGAAQTGRSTTPVEAPVAASAPRAGGWRLYGQVEQVLDGHSADLLLVAAHAGGFARSRTLLFLVPGDAPGLVRTRQTALDATRPQARVQLRDVRAELLGEGDGVDVLGALARTGDTAAAALACEAVGAADRVLETTVEYVKQREQFGRPVGSFQAVKHRLADVYVQLQAARSAAYFAAWAAVHEEQRVGGLALAQALEALRTAAAEGIQLHGGIGFTWEHEAHMYFKRATADELLFGPAHRLRAHAADAARLFERAEVSV